MARARRLWTWRLGPLLVVAGATGLWTGCPPGDDGPEPEPEPEPEVGGFDLADVGAPCAYVNGTGDNPTSGCAQGLTCLITSSDGVYTNNRSNSFWEDQTTVYTDQIQNGAFVDEGYCTKVSTTDDTAFTCPGGTAAKVFSPNVIACMKTCTQNEDCGRQGYVCDVRHFDIAQGHCVRACRWDAPDCVRSGVGSTADGSNPLQAFVALEDLQGASMCDVGTGLCVDAPGNGGSGPGEACTTTADCAGGLTCYQGERFFDGATADQGVCGFACAPDPAGDADANRAACAGAVGHVCQAAFRGGFVPFAAKSLSDGNDFVAGGLCFPDCTLDPNICLSHPGTACAALNDSLGEPWNGVSMCLLPPLRN